MSKQNKTFLCLVAVRRVGQSRVAAAAAAHLGMPEKTMSFASKRNDESVIDTSRMSEGQRAALEVTEAAREAAAMERTFAGGLCWDVTICLGAGASMTFRGPRSGGCLPLRAGRLSCKRTNPDDIDERGEIPDEVIEGLARLGAFGIKIPTKYGGLGLSQTNYCRAAMLLGSWCGNMTALLSAHQSIGVPQPLLLFGSEQQQQEYLPSTSQRRNLGLRADGSRRRI